MDETASAIAAAGFAERGGLRRLDDDDDLVGADLTPNGVFVGWVDVAWNGPAMPEGHLRDVVHVPHAQIESRLAQIESRLAQIESRLARAVERARKRGEAAKRLCRYCGDRFVPGHMESRDVCQGCASDHLGVVY